MGGRGSDQPCQEILIPAAGIHTYQQLVSNSDIIHHQVLVTALNESVSWFQLEVESLSHIPFPKKKYLYCFVCVCVQMCSFPKEPRCEQQTVKRRSNVPYTARGSWCPRRWSVCGASSTMRGEAEDGAPRREVDVSDVRLTVVPPSR